jgi:hypothetical protein
MAPENVLYPTWKPLPEELLARAQQVLEDVARRRTTITYTELSEAVPGVGRRGPHVASVLEVLGRRSLAERDILITVLVVNKSDGLPSHGFFDLQRDVRPGLAGDRTALARHERERVYRAYPLA